MAQLIVRTQKDRSNQTGEEIHFIHKSMTTVGNEPSYDVLVQTDTEGILFSLLRQENREFHLVPGNGKIRVNGKKIFNSLAIQSCDQIDWEDGVGIFLQTESTISLDSKPGASMGSLHFLHHLAGVLRKPTSFPPGKSGIQQTLDKLIEMAEAEVGYILTERGSDSSWKLLAKGFAAAEGVEEVETSEKTLISHTILNEAIETRKPVYFENLIGHPMSNAVSVIESRIFSVACLPLIIGDKVFGAVFLISRSPGKSIRREALSEIGLLATQASLLLASNLELAQAKRENTALKKGREHSKVSHVAMINESFDKKLTKSAETPLSILLLGETGVGKDVVAKLIHERSPLKSGPFIAVNCAAIPETLLESILFGHEKGAFTGAMERQIGKFEQAHQGTLFLDEVGDLPTPLQAKLLRVLQDKMVEPLGSKKGRKIETRVLAATHQNLEDKIKKGAFRQDLYFRLAGLVLKVPPLRERKEEIPKLCRVFIERLDLPVQLSPLALKELQSYHWPGNVRELEQVITRAAFFAEGDQIEPGDFDFGNSLHPDKRVLIPGFENALSLKEYL